MDGGHDVQSHPDRQQDEERADETPAADGIGQGVGHAITQGEPLFVQGIDVGRRAAEKKLAHLLLQVAQPCAHVAIFHPVASPGWHDSQVILWGTVKAYKFGPRELKCCQSGKRVTGSCYRKSADGL